jgi:hypothetical protein
MFILKLVSIVTLFGGTTVLANSFTDLNLTSVVHSDFTRFIGGIRIVIPLSTIKFTDRPFLEASTANIHSTLPEILRLVNISSDKIPNLVSRAIPIFNSAILAIGNEKDLLSMSPSSRIKPRNIFEDGWNWIKETGKEIVQGGEEVLVDAGCGVFAAGALPAYLTAAAAFEYLNAQITPLSSSIDQDYFLFPVHGNFMHDDNLGVYYSSHLPPGFEGKAGATFARHIFTKLGPATMASDADFLAVAKLWIHEMQHCRQYKNRDWNLVVFGTEYLFNFCKAGFSYLGNVMEQEAVNAANKIDPLLVDKDGVLFFQVWKANPAVAAALGLPTEASYRTVQFFPSTVWELNFQHGGMQIMRGAGGGACFRTWSESQNGVKSAADCQRLTDCGSLTPAACKQSDLACTAAQIAWTNSVGAFKC